MIFALPAPKMDVAGSNPFSARVFNRLQRVYGRSSRSNPPRCYRSEGCLPDSRCGFPVGRETMRVEVERDALVSMTEALTDDRERRSVAEQDRCVRVAQRMEGGVRILGLTQQCLGPRAHVIGRVKVAVGLGEDQVVGSIGGSESEPCPDSAPLCAARTSKAKSSRPML